ncbi:MAG: response regulator [Sphingobacteriales bacterium]|nr:MAG: response regulator [Sphingobacteriales bacterium]
MRLNPQTHNCYLQTEALWLEFSNTSVEFQKPAPRMQSSILLVEDDQDDIDLVKQAIEALQIKRRVEYFRSGQELIAYLKRTEVAPMVVICDVNLPGETGFDVKDSIIADPELKYKAVPFIFWSTTASERQIQHAYDLSAQGFFTKPTTFEALCETFSMIVKYWEKSEHPKKIF